MSAVYYRRALQPRRLGASAGLPRRSACQIPPGASSARPAMAVQAWLYSLLPRQGSSSRAHVRAQPQRAGQKSHQQRRYLSSAHQHHCNQYKTAKPSASPFVPSIAVQQTSHLIPFTRSRTGSNSLISRNHFSSTSKMAVPHVSLQEALSKNAAWASSTAAKSPDFFKTSAEKPQEPKILWLGCSDSRVPESTVLDLPPGSVFVHRNIANIFTAQDLSSLSVIQYGVGSLGVQHVVVCGHTGCGGVTAALGNSRLGVIDAWLAPLRVLRARLQAAGGFDSKSAAERSLALVEENVREGVRSVRSNPDIVAGIKQRGVTVHGLIYDLATGRLRELDVPESPAETAAREDAFTLQ